ncbi:anaerobic ribonucleoside-triphosphate reductase activating protein [Chromobacterium subtsugae]|uniref:Anaerobic ribonucleoside-triphosphate reductase-activating protein n=1 Tax=Chromobacterium subtsugae TaxID=251747 RepID=A0ABS7FF39_9NEIS|nr:MULTISPECIES: anaerobic ribonucleoside-triphosphate reductase activating protein [Chromobacterium]KUM01877.1 anaerobic ribonucleoside-triphosphate reductase activating protein [Chromobacterium subtsugae]KZE88229.1 anaerobic ribonucleoside-triphosphate reductase activating protein [Chromobacterium sp. F49]MBW8287919.1 anaerobic ribonucleoside-triphosphate reductase activating protein [Chromobacterium subtsugae]OBU86929.1 ribonucleoside-triphosphate reductase [Chromobacterium subtsugae]WSE896
MNYDRYYTCDLVNGEGVRVTLFVTGCAHACEGCHNRSTWDRKSGRPFTAQVREALLAHCAGHDGLSLSGGDPLLPANRDEILSLCRAFKQRYPGKSIWLWTGYDYEEVRELEILRFVDVLIDGRYRRDLPTSKPWRGSDNQRLFRLAPARGRPLLPVTQLT